MLRLQLFLCHDSGRSGGLDPFEIRLDAADRFAHPHDDLLAHTHERGFGVLALQLPLVVGAPGGAVAERIAQDEARAIIVVIAVEVFVHGIGVVFPESCHAHRALEGEGREDLVFGEFGIEVARLHILLRLDDFRPLRDGRVDGFLQADGFEGHDRLVERGQTQVLTQVLFRRIEQAAQLILLVSNRFIRNQDLLDPRGDGRFGLQDVDDRHDAGLRFGAVAGQEFLRRLQGCLCHFQIFIGEDNFPIGLFHRSQDGEDAIAKDMFLDGGIVLSDADEGLGDVEAGVAEQGLRERQGEAAGVGRVEQEATGRILIHRCPRGTIVHVDVAAGEQVSRRIERDGVIPLIEGRNLAQGAGGSAEYRPVERVHCSVVLTVDAERRVELGLFDGDIGLPAFFRLAADADVQIMFQRLERRVGQGDGLPPFRGRSFAQFQAPAESRRQDQAKVDGITTCAPPSVCSCMLLHGLPL